MKKTFDTVLSCPTNNMLVMHRTSDWQYFGQVQLIVANCQEAIFFYNGQLLDSFGPGVHELLLPDPPLTDRMFGRGNSNSNYYVSFYFFNLFEFTDIRWGTETRAQFIDPVYNCPLSVGASGTLSFGVYHARKFLMEYVDSEDDITSRDILRRFNPIIQATVKSSILQVIDREKLSVFNLDAYSEELSQAIESDLTAEFTQYGIALTEFTIETISLPEDDEVYWRPKNMHANSLPTAERGIPISATDEELALYCSRCGLRFQNEDRFCPRCGSKR